MSGTSFNKPCPNCGKDMNSYSDYKPFDYVSGECAYCGFTYRTIGEQMSLEELNEVRVEQDLKPLKKLPKINNYLVD
jgi:hypothetical protein